MAGRRESDWARRERLQVNRAYGLDKRRGDLFPITFRVPAERFASGLGPEKTSVEVALVRIEGAAVKLRIRRGDSGSGGGACVLFLGVGPQGRFVDPSCRELAVGAEEARAAFSRDRAARVVQGAWRARAFARSKLELLTRVDDLLFDSPGVRLPWDVAERVLRVRLRDHLASKYSGRARRDC